MRDNMVVIGGYYGFGNAGDELILRSLVDRLRQESPNVSITVLSADPLQTQDHFGVDAINRWNPVAWIRAFSQARRFVLGGGGLLQESTSAWNYIYYLSLTALAKLLGCRTEVRAIGVDPVQHRLNRWMTRLVFNHFVDSVSVRDTDSQLALEASGVKIVIARVPDLVFQFPTPAPTPIQNRVALALAPWPQRPGWEHDLSLVCDLLITTLKVSIDLLVFSPEQDAVLSEKTARAATQSIQVRSWTTPEQLIGWMAEYELIIGMRYHALVLAALAEKPFIGWGFQRKVRSLCRDFGQPLWSFERGWETDAVFRQVCEAWRHRDLLPHRYSSRLPQLRTAIPVLHDVPRIFPAQVL
ncbi:MAG: polysaccharide pyruvyl transferase CsaB [Elusimicrobiota bacterium]|jgi:polysaccharide pyruvyl transferase CsaB